MKLTKVERLILWNQYEIRKRLDPKQTEHCETVQDALQSGYEAIYEHVLERMSDEEISIHDAQFVYDVFDMYDAFNRFEGTSGVIIDNYMAKFRGFDGHGDLVGFARFNVKTLDRWKWLNIEEFDAHFPIEPTYRRMLEVWKRKPLPDRITNLIQADVDAILAAAIHPEK